jgi:hypothetical protein
MAAPRLGLSLVESGSPPQIKAEEQAHGAQRALTLWYNQ